MNSKTFASTCLLGLALGVSIVTGCAGDRPMRNGVDSLNVAAAAAVAFWELNR